MTGGAAVPEGADPTRPAPSASTPEAAATKDDETRPTPRALAVLVAVPLLVLALDQITKQLAIAHLTDARPVRLLGGMVYLNLTRNSGAAFSIGRDVTYLFPIIAVAVIIGIVWLARRLRSVPWSISLGLIVGGAVGNLADRLLRQPGLFRGQVVDMISLFDEAGRVFPAGAIFNVADSALFCGVVLAIVLELTGRHRDGSRHQRASAPDDRAAA